MLGKIYYHVVMASLLVLHANNLYAFDESRLWLPLKYEKFYLKLKKAAEAAENLERCSTLLEATLDLEKSSTYAPFFKVLCRQPNGRTYIEIVDGTTFTTLTTKTPVVEVITPEDIEAQRLEKLRLEKEEKLRKQRAAFMKCKDKLLEKTQFMAELSLLFADDIKPDIEDDKHIFFTLDFNAQDPDKNNLYYRAYCTLTSEDAMSLKIKPRRD